MEDHEDNEYDNQLIVGHKPMHHHLQLPVAVSNSGQQADHVGTYLSFFGSGFESSMAAADHPRQSSTLMEEEFAYPSTDFTSLCSTVGGGDHHEEVAAAAAGAQDDHNIGVCNNIVGVAPPPPDRKRRSGVGCLGFSSCSPPCSHDQSGGGGDGGDDHDNNKMMIIRSVDIDHPIIYGGNINNNNVNGRWPRHETMSLLEVRSQLDVKFREAVHKGPLWDEIARLMAEEYGYMRSGKKCREKFENLYKYYKKTKEGRAGRQNGKHYRFYSQLEALCGGELTNKQLIPQTMTNISTPNNNNPHHHHLSNDLPTPTQIQHNINDPLTNDTNHQRHSPNDHVDDKVIGEFDVGSTSSGSSEDDYRCNWRRELKGFMEKQTRRIMEKQEEWLVKLTTSLEHKEEERIARQEAWRKEESDRLRREHQFWSKEREWIEARDVAMLEALRKVVSFNEDDEDDHCGTNNLYLHDQVHVQYHQQVHDGEQEHEDDANINETN